MSVVEGGMMPIDQLDGDPGSTHVDMPLGSPVAGSLDDVLGLAEAGPRVIAPPPNKDVDSFMRAANGEEDLEGSEETNIDDDLKDTLRQVVEQNRELAAALGKQGQEVVGPQRQEIETLQQQVTALQQQIAGGANGQGPDLEAIAANLFPGEDPNDETVRKHSQAHLNALNLATVGIKEEIVGPLQQQIDSLTRRLGDQTLGSMVGDINPQTVASLTEKHPILRNPNVPVEEKAAMIRDLASQASPPTPNAGGLRPFRDARLHVEGTRPSGASRADTGQVARQRFDAMDTPTQERALGQYLAQQGRDALGF